ncbi:alpha-amylase family glycosyl hydrolase [Sediminibacterium soli]|uniref:alpha-amylase family glycosyl hydrolase n=1 Tax=Sediminibacterium soli TaxID=2698829 RepID=UPI0013794CCC|nr:alpha-amylase family glycosyl hydrolase [Sediminibacterium soli]NCI46900.1 1,4-alpha-glucan branching protein [Sediminibacterium soli]
MRRKFSTVEWAKGSNIYEVNIRQYTPEGNFAAFAAHLPRLQQMGVEILWFMPVTPISIRERQGTLGSYYACSSYTAVNPEFGSVDDFRQLVTAAHASGMKVIIDWVANHTGWDHEWTLEHPHWYLKDEQGNFTEKNGWHDVIDLDFTSAEMRQAMIDSMRFWIDACDIDGFRCDMAHLVPLDFWKEARTACDAVKPLFWLAECEVVEYHDVFDASYSWWWMHVSEGHAKGRDTLADMRNLLHAYSQYPEDAWKLFFTSNHDENSWNGSEYEKYGSAALPWAVFAHTWTGLSLIYSGQESPNQKRLKFFDKDPIEWNQPLQLAGFYKALLSLRNNPAIRSGETFILPSAYDNQLMVYLRRNGNDVVLVILNVSKDNRLSVRVSHPWLNGDFRNLFSGLVFSFKDDETFELQAGEYFVYQRIP